MMTSATAATTASPAFAAFQSIAAAAAIAAIHAFVVKGARQKKIHTHGSCKSESTVTTSNEEAVLDL